MNRAANRRQVYTEPRPCTSAGRRLPHIFDRFYRAKNVAGRIPGTGIGFTRAFIG